MVGGSLARNIDFGMANFQVPEKSRRKTSILMLQSVKIGGSLARDDRFGAPTCLVSSLWFSCGLAVSLGGAAKPCPFRMFPTVKIAEVSHEMVVLVLPRLYTPQFPFHAPHSTLHTPWFTIDTLKIQFHMFRHHHP